MRTSVCLSVTVLIVVATARAQSGWHMELWGANGGYWSLRVPVAVRNLSNNDLSGYVLSLRVGNMPGELPLAGQPPDRLRVCHSAGGEYLYEVVPTRGGQPLRAGDSICFAVDVPAGREETFYFYAGNPVALPDDLTALRASLRNGTFNEGATTPADWSAFGTSPQHLAQYLRTGGRNGTACVYHRVQVGAAPAWVQWSQSGIVVTPGRRYVVRGWVWARGVVGQCGYYVHVHGIRPQMVNIVQSAGDGTYDWRQVEIRFEVPAGGQTLTVGTVLYGTGEAWYDDVTVQAEEGDTGSQVAVRVLPVERRELKPVRAVRDSWERTWLVRATVVARNFSGDTLERAVMVSLPRAVHMVRRLSGAVRLPLRAKVVDVQTGATLPATWIGDAVCFMARLPGLSETRYEVYLSREPAGEESLRSYEQMLRHRANLAREGDFESRERTLQLWASGGEATGNAGFVAEWVSPGRFGSGALRLQVPSERQRDWLGWRLLNVRVAPSTCYLYAAWVKTQGITEGSVDIHGHFKATDNSLTRGAPFFGSARRLTGDNDWTLCWSQVMTLEDAHHVELHLTMNTCGTVWHDGVLFLPVEQGVVRRVDANPTLLPREPFFAWQVNPLVKVSPDDPPQATSKSLTAECARNEWEPVQIAVWSRTDLRGVQVRVSPLKHTSGATLPPPRLYRVMTVPVDVPTNYYFSRLPLYRRHVPADTPSSDGWAGEWPDPLAPLRSFDLPARRTQALWLDCYVPEGTAPGEYRATVTVLASGKTLLQLPLRLTVWNFTLPERSHLRVVYYLRSGPGWDVTRGEDTETLKQWYRLMAEYRVSPDVVLPAPHFQVVDGRVPMDASRFEPMARYALDELGFNHCYTPWGFYALGWGYPLGSKFGHEPRTPEYEDTLRNAYRQLVELFTRNGWRDRLVYYLSDEPHLSNQKVADDLRYFIEVIKPVAPDVPIFSSTWGHYPQLDGYLNIWGMAQFGGFPVEKMRERRAAGDRLLFTTDGQHALDTPYLATERLLPLYCFAYDVEGYEFWGFSWWTHDPWRRGWHQYISQSGEGQEFYWVRYPNGDGYVAYPGEPLGLTEPQPSIRLKAIREGAEDYEYYRLWSQLVQERLSRGETAADAEQLRHSMEAMVPIPNAGGLRSTEILPDPDAMYRLRRRIAEAILKLSR